MAETERKAIVVLMTAANRKEARGIAEMLVEKQLAACVQILPEIRSVYRWKGELQHEKEVLLLAKTTLAVFNELERQVRAMHSYETPEVVALPIIASSAPYLKWLLSEV